MLTRELGEVNCSANPGVSETTCNLGTGNGFPPNIGQQRFFNINTFKPHLQRWNRTRLEGLGGEWTARGCACVCVCRGGGVWGGGGEFPKLSPLLGPDFPHVCRLSGGRGTGGAGHHLVPTTLNRPVPGSAAARLGHGATARPAALRCAAAEERGAGCAVLGARGARC